MSKKHPREPETTWQKIWHFIWYEDSLLSWAANIVLAFIIIKFLIYPLLSLVFGTSLPVVAVISCSMDHGYTNCGQDAPDNLCGIIGEGPRDLDSYWTTCGDFYEQRGITKEEFSDYPLSHGFRKGDVIVLAGVAPEKVSLGDVLVFSSDRAYPIIHRVVDIKETDTGYIYQTKGDHNPTQIIDGGLDETNVPNQVVIGRGIFRIPFLGYIKILAVDGISLLTGK
ncbi:MAG: signal peptidase I [Nanoarchaeota archaeon]|nr:signal peptidase I [Nanoarchaeota archaeon]